MSALQVANVQFESTLANRIDYVSGNLNITSANVNFNGLLTSNTVYSPVYYDASNTSYYMDPAANSVFDNLGVAQMGLSRVTYMSKGNYNIFMMIINEKLYTTCGTTGTTPNHATGRGLTATTPTFGMNSLRPVTFLNETGKIKKAGPVGASAFALFTNGNFYTWGYNLAGECGNGTTSPIATPTLIDTGVSDAWGSDYMQSDNSPNYPRMFYKKNNNLYAAGYNGYGQLGDGTTVNKTSFTRLDNNLGISHPFYSSGNVGSFITNVWCVGGQYGFTFFESNGGLWAAGLNGQGQLGNGNTTNQSTPVDVATNWGMSAGSPIVKVIGGSCFHDGTNVASAGWAGILTSAGTFRMAGYNGQGQLGDASTTSRSTPVTPNVGSGAISQIGSNGQSYASVALLKSDGTLYTWGYNGYGQLGNGNTTNQSTPGIRDTGVTGLFYDMSNVVQGYVSSGFMSKADGLYSAGYNGYGQLGVGDTTNRSSFTKVILPKDFVVADIGTFYSTWTTQTYLAVSTDGRMYAWGYNGQNNITADSAVNCLAPVKISLPLGA
jgi:alpha-tubulin suppressor-like RCC1 family protein